MDFLQYPMAINETSFRVIWLHTALKILGYTPDKTEEAAHRAGETTLQQVRACQKEMNIQFDDSCLLDNETFEAMVKKLKEKNSTQGNNAFLVSGMVHDRLGAIVKRQKLIAFDVDLKGMAIYNKVGSLDEMKNGSFMYLHDVESDTKGFYKIKFSPLQLFKDEHKVDVVVFAVDEDKIIGRSRLVNSSDYADKTEVKNLNIVVTKKEEKTEYELLIIKLKTFLEENNVELVELAASNAQVHFTARELDEDENKIQVAADAEKLRGDKKEISYELLYGLGRQQISLDWLMLYKRKNNELASAIERSVKSGIIRKFSREQVQAFLALIHTNAASFVLQ